MKAIWGGKHSVPLVMLGAGLHFRPHRVLIACTHFVLRVTNAVAIHYVDVHTVQGAVGGACHSVEF